MDKSAETSALARQSGDVGAIRECRDGVLGRFDGVRFITSPTVIAP